MSNNLYVRLPYDSFDHITDCLVEEWTQEGVEQSQDTLEPADARYVLKQITVKELVEFYLKHNGTLPDAPKED